MPHGQISRPAFIEFSDDGLPKRGHCTCPVGLSGVCCHTLCLLHFLMHLTITGEKFLALTPAQQLQKWHKKGQPGKGSIPMLPVHKLVKVPSARIKKVKSGSKREDGYKTGKDFEPSGLRRNIQQQIKSYQEKFRQTGFSNIEKHFHDVLQKKRC